MPRLRGRCRDKCRWDNANEVAAQTLDSIFTMMTTTIDEVLAFKMQVILLLTFGSMMSHTMYGLLLIKVRSAKDYIVQASMLTSRRHTDREVVYGRSKARCYQFILYRRTVTAGGSSHSRFRY